MASCVKCGRPAFGSGVVTRMRRGQVVYAHRICPARKFARGKKPPRRKPSRHFRRWPAQTELAHFFDPRSFVSLPDANGVPHEILFGEDKEVRRRDIFARAEGLCELRSDADCEIVADWENGEWHHVKGGDWGRCDDMANSKWACKSCHSKEHR